MKKLLLLALGAAAVGAHAQIAINASSVAFVDISGTGTSVGTISDDSESTVTGSALTTAGWTGNGLLAGGVSIRVGNNGGLIWGNSATDAFSGATDVGYYNASPLNSGTPTATSIATMASANGASNGNGGGVRQFLAVLWDDNTPGTGASIKWQVIGSDLIVQWTNEDHFAAAGTGTITYEMIAHGGVSIGSGSSLVDFVYNDTLYAASQYQNDGGSATIGYKNWSLNALANDVEYGVGGGGTSSVSDPAFGDSSMKPKVGGWSSSADGALTHSVTIQAVPEPTSIAAIGLGAIGLIRKRRNRV